MDQLKNKLGSAAIVLGTAGDGKVSLVAGVTKDHTGRVKAGELVNTVASRSAARRRAARHGPGRRQPARALDAALQSVPDWVRARLQASQTA